MAATSSFEPEEGCRAWQYLEVLLEKATEDFDSQSDNQKLCEPDNGTSDSEDATSSCKVCGDPTGSKVHYGVLTCDACSCFFRRSQMEPVHYQCIKGQGQMCDITPTKGQGQMCDITPTNRTDCRFCRWKKCLDLGMFLPDIHKTGKTGPKRKKYKSQSGHKGRKVQKKYHQDNQEGQQPKLAMTPSSTRGHQTPVRNGSGWGPSSTRGHQTPVRNGSGWEQLSMVPPCNVSPPSPEVRHYTPSPPCLVQAGQLCLQQPTTSLLAHSSMKYGFDAQHQLQNKTMSWTNHTDNKSSTKSSGTTNYKADDYMGLYPTTLTPLKGTCRSRMYQPHFKKTTHTAYQVPGNADIQQSSSMNTSNSHEKGDVNGVPTNPTDVTRQNKQMICDESPLDLRCDQQRTCSKDTGLDTHQDQNAKDKTVTFDPKVVQEFSRRTVIRGGGTHFSKITESTRAMCRKVRLSSTEKLLLEAHTFAPLEVEAGNKAALKRTGVDIHSIIKKVTHGQMNKAISGTTCLGLDNDSNDCMIENVEDMQNNDCNTSICQDTVVMTNSKSSNVPTEENEESNDIGLDEGEQSTADGSFQNIEEDGCVSCTGKMVWASFGKNHQFYPGILFSGKPWHFNDPKPGCSWIFWFGDHQISQVKVKTSQDFTSNFKRHYSEKGTQRHSKAQTTAVVEALKVFSRLAGEDSANWKGKTVLKWAMQDGLKKRRAQQQTQLQEFELPGWVKLCLNDLQQEQNDNTDKDSGCWTGNGQPLSQASSKENTSTVGKAGGQKGQSSSSEPCEGKHKLLSSPSLALASKGQGQGRLVWASLKGKNLWPAILIDDNTDCNLETPKTGYQWVFWCGDHKRSQVQLDKITPFFADFKTFADRIKTKSFHASIVEAIQIYAMMAEVDVEGWTDEEMRSWADQGFPHVEGWTDEEMRSWADQGFPQESSHQKLEIDNKFALPDWVLKCLLSLYDDNEDGVAYMTKPDETTTEARWRVRASRFDYVMTKMSKKEINKEDVCLGCFISPPGGLPSQHPLFHAGQCEPCRDTLMDILFLFEDDGTNIYCVICSGEGQLFICDSPNCGRVYCEACVLCLVGTDLLESLRNTDDSWICFLCAEYSHETHGFLEPRKDWNESLISGAVHSEPLDVNSFTPTKPIRVLSLFDGIAAGKVVLDNLSIKVEKYYTCEIDHDAIRVVKAYHGETITPLGDVTKITGDQIKDICPINLVIGGSPCNDLSIVNPARKGLYDGSGTLFFQYLRILNLVKEHNKETHVFWLFENVSSMIKTAKNDISNFLGCKPASWDAKMFSAQSRPRAFWGNIPGLYRMPTVRELKGNRTLSDVLTPHINRTLTVDSLRTLTTNPNSLRQGKDYKQYPVTMDGEKGTLYIPEIERLFGLPAHYTDVGDLTPRKRQVLIGRSWSIQVVQYILAPLKQLFSSQSQGHCTSSCASE